MAIARQPGVPGRLCGHKLAPAAASPELTEAATLADSLPAANPAWAASAEAAVALAEHEEAGAEEHVAGAVAASFYSPFALRP